MAKKRYEIAEIGLINVQVVHSGKTLTDADLRAQQVVWAGISGRCAVFERNGRNPPEPVCIWERSA
jgi:hypothetical protein